MTALQPDEIDDVLKIVGRLSAKQGWESYKRRMEAIRGRINATQRAAIPPMPAGSILGDNFRPCALCECPRECSERDSCGRGL